MAACDVTVVEPRYDYRDNVIGYYNIEEYSQTYGDYTYYSLRIVKDGYSGNSIYLNNFYGADIRVRAYLDNGRIRIPYQVVNDYEVEGSGTLQGHDLSLSYYVRDLYNHAPKDFCDTWANRDYQ
jgi:hypothetical protein